MARAAKGLFKKKRGGKDVGNWRTSVKGKEINLLTSDPDEALRRMRKARKGDLDFEAPGQAAEATAATLAGEPIPPAAVTPPPPADEGPRVDLTDLISKDVRTPPTAGADEEQRRQSDSGSGTATTPGLSVASAGTSQQGVGGEPGPIAGGPPAPAPAVPSEPPPSSAATGSDPNPQTESAAEVAAGAAAGAASDVFAASAAAAARVAGPAAPADDGQAGTVSDADLEALGVDMGDVEELFKLGPKELAEIPVGFTAWLGGLMAKARGKIANDVPPEQIGRRVLTLGWYGVIKHMKADGIKVHPGYLILGGTVAMLAAQNIGAKDAERAQAGV